MTYSDYKNIFNRFIEYAKANKRCYGNPRWLDDDHTINVIGVRMNDEIDFNDKKYNNDKLYIIQNRPNDMYIAHEYNVTVDPATNKYRIAHLCEGAYESYIVRPHRWIIGRTALCQDAGEVRIVRTDLRGGAIVYEWGYFGINIHNAGGFRNSSLGCTIYLDEYHQEIKQILLNAKNHQDKFTYCIINHKTFNKIKNELSIN